MDYRMRADMQKVVVERERYGSSRKSRKWGQRLAFVPDADYEDQRTFVSSARGRQYGYGSKSFSDVLGPLEGFLHRNLRRPWNKVFSELRQGLDVRKVTGRHIFDHLASMVETNCWVGEDRRIYSLQCGRQQEVEGFYVNPKTELLCFKERPSARERKKAELLAREIEEVRLDDLHSFRLIAGQWYLVSYEIIQVGRYQKPQFRWDCAQRREVALTWGTHRVAVTKRQCNREEVRRIHERIAEWKKQARKV
jgi:hypothetical protein